MVELPTGTITLLFADIEASTALLRELGPEQYGTRLAEYRQVVRAAIASHGGTEIETEGDGFFVAFPTAREALAGAVEAQRALTERGLRTRMGLQTGEPLVVDGHYSGIDVHKAARICDAGHGGQILLSQSTFELLETSSRIRDLGQYRLKDLGEPVRLYQFGDAEFPPVRSLHSTNLPVAPTPLVGRERELEEATRLLRAHRLVTLTGAGGSGKTRLALQLAADVADDFPDGVSGCRYTALRDPELVLPTIARELGASEKVVEQIGHRRLLLVLDNFEQLLPSASKLSDLLTRLDHVKLLVTSREPLHVAAERAYPVAPLREREAVALFLDRAQAVHPDLAHEGEIVEICRRLDCLPLALELAAARVKALSIPELLKRLDKRLPILTGGPLDAPERQRTLRATIAWSYELLTPEEQRVFAALAVFTGGCTLEAAEEICDATLDTIAALIDKSLLRREQDRYTMLETIAEYALERLEELGELEQLRRRHGEYYVKHARSVRRLIRSPQAAKLLDRLERDHGNLRDALSWVPDDDPDRSLQLAVWGIAARLHGFGDLALKRHDLVEASRFYRASLEYGLQVDDDRQTAYSLAGLAAVDAQLGRRDLAARLWGSVNAFEQASGTRLHETERLPYERLLGELEEASDTSADFAEGEAMSLDRAVEEALANVD